MKDIGHVPPVGLPTIGTGNAAINIYAVGTSTLRGEGIRPAYAGNL